jgi:hypothetical protein
MPSNPDRLLRIVLILTAMTMIVIWLPFIRGLMDGSTYQWGNSFLGLQYGGHGIAGYYWLIVLQAAFCVALMYLGWRGARQPFHWLLLIWNIPHAINAAYHALRYPEEYRFHGDTLGVEVSLAWVGPFLFGGLALLSLIWVIRDRKPRQLREIPVWNRTNKVSLLITVAIIPVQFFLLRFGEPDGTADQLGVILTMLQWLVLNLSFVGWRSREALSREAHT